MPPPYGTCSHRPPNAMQDLLLRPYLLTKTQDTPPPRYHRGMEQWKLPALLDDAPKGKNTLKGTMVDTANIIAATTSANQADLLHHSGPRPFITTQFPPSLQ